MDEKKYRYIDEKGEHLHTYDGKPLMGTSSVVGIIAKPLTWWASGMAVKQLGWRDPKKTSKEDRDYAAASMLQEISQMETDEYMKLLDKAYRAHADNLKETAGDGTDMHAALEEYVKQSIVSTSLTYHGDNPFVQKFSLWAQLNVKKFLWSEMYCYSLELWTGGVADVGWETNDGSIVAGDFKSSKEAYLSQFIQIAGYDIALTENGGFRPNGEKIFELPKPIEQYCVIPFGADEFSPAFIKSTEPYKEGFKAAVKLTQLKNSYE